MRFDDRMSKSGFVLLPPERHPGGDILIAERPIVDEDIGLAMQMVWFVRRGKQEIPIGSSFLTTRNTPNTVRRAAAIKDAETFIADNIDVGRFPAN